MFGVVTNANDLSVKAPYFNVAGDLLDSLCIGFQLEPRSCQDHRLDTYSTSVLCIVWHNNIINAHCHV